MYSAFQGMQKIRRCTPPLKEHGIVEKIRPTLVRFKWCKKISSRPWCRRWNPVIQAGQSGKSPWKKKVQGDISIYGSVNCSFFLSPPTFHWLEFIPRSKCLCTAYQNTQESHPGTWGGWSGPQRGSGEGRSRSGWGPASPFGRGGRGCRWWVGVGLAVWVRDEKARSLCS